MQPENVIAGNGSDEILAFSFRAFCGEGKPLAYADITYGFYKSQVALFGLESKVIPLREDFTLNVDDYMDFPGTIVIANPNAPTGMAVPRTDIRRLLEADPNRVVIVDEAYVDFGGESCVPMISDHENLLVVQTMSKSRSLAGGRVGLRHRLSGADCRAEPGEIQLQSLQRQPSQHGGRNGRHGGRGLFPRLHRRRLQQPRMDGTGTGKAGLHRAALSDQLHFRRDGRHSRRGAVPQAERKRNSGPLV